MKSQDIFVIEKSNLNFYIPKMNFLYEKKMFLKQNNK